jgi:hypothetical protein
MMKLKVSPEQAYRRLAAIAHTRFQQALPRYWHVDGQGRLQAQTILWLYCWAKTGLNSEQTAQDVRNAMNAIFDHPYAWLETRIAHDYARKARYATGDIEAEFQAKLSATH